MKILACPHCGAEIARIPGITTTTYGPSTGRFAVFELIDPRDRSTIQVGAGVAKGWRQKARKIWSERTEHAIKALTEAGLKPEPRLISFCATREDAMRLKLKRCVEIGQAFRGTSRKALGRKKVPYLSRHRQEGATI